MDTITYGVRNEPFSAYLDCPAINRGAIVQGLRSMAHMRRAIDWPAAPTKAMIDGQIIHTAVLEREEYARRYAVLPAELAEGIMTRAGEPAKAPKQTAEYRDRVAAWQAARPNAERIDSETNAMCLGIVRAIDRHPIARTMMASADRVECTVVADICGTPIKVRPDVIGSDGTIWDLKSTEDARPRAFGVSAHHHHYPVQLALYRDVCSAAGIAVSGCRIVAVEKSPPYAVRVYVVPADQISYGRAQYESVLAQYAEAVRTGEWPGYPDDLDDLHCPAWAAGSGPDEAMPNFDAAIGGTP